MITTPIPGATQGPGPINLAPGPINAPPLTPNQKMKMELAKYKGSNGDSFTDANLEKAKQSGNTQFINEFKEAKDREIKSSLTNQGFTDEKLKDAINKGDVAYIDQFKAAYGKTSNPGDDHFNNDFKAFVNKHYTKDNMNQSINYMLAHHHSIEKDVQNNTYSSAITLDNSSSDL